MKMSIVNQPCDPWILLRMVNIFSKEKFHIAHNSIDYLHLFLSADRQQYVFLCLCNRIHFFLCVEMNKNKIQCITYSILHAALHISEMEKTRNIIYIRKWNFLFSLSKISSLFFYVGAFISLTLVSLSPTTSRQPIERAYSPQLHVFTSSSSSSSKSSSASGVLILNSVSNKNFPVRFVALTEDSLPVLLLHWFTKFSLAFRSEFDNAIPLM